jgi:hypothetical protein
MSYSVASRRLGTESVLDKFIGDHVKETGRVLVVTYTPSSSKEYTFTVAFSTNGRVIFQVREICVALILH